MEHEEHLSEPERPMRGLFALIQERYTLNKKWAKRGALAAGVGLFSTVIFSLGASEASQKVPYEKSTITERGQTATKTNAEWYDTYRNGALSSEILLAGGALVVIASISRRRVEPEIPPPEQIPPEGPPEPPPEA